MPREFIRLKVGTFRRKAFGTDRRPAYPAAAVVAFYGVVELAEEQPERGRFDSERLLRVLLEGRNGQGRQYARQINYLIEHGDLVRLPDGRLYVDGWDELQTGDLTVADRVSRHRNRHANASANGSSNADANPPDNEAPRAGAIEGTKDDGLRTKDGDRGRAPDDRDSLDTYHELTGFRPWGQFSGDSLHAATGDYGDATVDAALRAEYAANGDRNTLLKRALSRLAKDADREHQERKARPKPPRQQANEELMREQRRIAHELQFGVKESA